MFKRFLVAPTFLLAVLSSIATADPDNSWTEIETVSYTFQANTAQATDLRVTANADAMANWQADSLTLRVSGAGDDAVVIFATANGVTHTEGLTLTPSGSSVELYLFDILTPCASPNGACAEEIEVDFEAFPGTELLVEAAYVPYGVEPDSGPFSPSASISVVP